MSLHDTFSAFFTVASQAMELLKNCPEAKEANMQDR